jgi:hypothetical protein
MYFFNSRWTFKTPSTKDPIAGGVIAASAISPVNLQKRKFDEFPYLRRRVLDPQLYMATIDPAIDQKTVANLAAYPWFHGGEVPKYKSDEYASRTQWKAAHGPKLVSKWTRMVPSGASTIRNAARAAVKFQLELGCHATILPGPLTAMDDQTLQSEVEWMDAGLKACLELRVERPVFATIAISEPLLHVRAFGNPLVHSLANHVTAREELAGAYIVFEQSANGMYFWNSKDPLMSLLVLVDDISRGAKKKVAVNYVGTFGIVTEALGAESWASGYYLVQRRLSLTAKIGRAHPRFYSLALAGDIGLRDDVDRVRGTRVGDELISATDASAVLRSALAKGKKVEQVPEWQYKQSNCSAAQQHYLELAARVGAELEKMSPRARLDWVTKWLEGAAGMAHFLKQKNLVSSSDVNHQQVWLDVFNEWRSYAKQ